MLDVLRKADQVRSRGGTLTFEGKDHGAGVSMFLLNAAPGTTVRQHVHPYAETWIVRGGQAEMTIGGTIVTVGPGDIITAGANTPHGFTTVGEEPFDAICIHASDRFVQEWV